MPCYEAIRAYYAFLTGLYAALTMMCFGAATQMDIVYFTLFYVKVLGYLESEVPKHQMTNWCRLIILITRISFLVGMIRLSKYINIMFNQALHSCLSTISYVVTSAFALFTFVLILTLLNTFLFNGKL